jgi:hypothetical protein
VKWLNRLELTDDLDALWPVFEAWLRERPENLDRYLALVRTRTLVDALSRWCPKEGSQAADRLLEQLKASAADRSRRAKWFFVTTTALLSAVALFCVTRLLV